MKQFLHSCHKSARLDQILFTACYLHDFHDITCRFVQFNGSGSFGKYMSVPIILTSVSTTFFLLHQTDIYKKKVALQSQTHGNPDGFLTNLMGLWQLLYAHRTQPKHLKITKWFNILLQSLLSSFLFQNRDLIYFLLLRYYFTRHQWGFGSCVCFWH